MADVFISYSKKDSEKVAKLEDALVDLEVNVWRDKNMAPGEDWPKELERQIDAAKALIVCWSRSAVESEWVSRETRRARKRIPVIPVAIEPQESFSLSLEFEEMQLSDLSNWNGEIEHESFLKILKSLGEKIGPRELGRHYDVWLDKKKETAEALARKAAADKLRAETDARIERDQKAQAQAELDNARAEFAAAQRRRFEELPVAKAATRAKEDAGRCKRESDEARADFERVKNLALVDIKWRQMHWGCLAPLLLFTLYCLVATIGAFITLHPWLMFFNPMFLSLCLLGLVERASFNLAALSYDARAARAEKTQSAATEAAVAHQQAQAAADEAWKPFQRAIDGFELKRPGV